MNEPVGLAAAFDVTGHEKELKKCLLKTDIVNKDTHQSLPLTMPVHFNFIPMKDSEGTPPSGEPSSAWDKIELTGPEAKILGAKDEL